MTHELKCWPLHFEAISNGAKNFEVRRGDRAFNCHDELLLREFIPDLGAPYRDAEGQLREPGYTGRELRALVCYVLRAHEGLAPGFVVLGIVPI